MTRCGPLEQVRFAESAPRASCGGACFGADRETLRLTVKLAYRTWIAIGFAVAAVALAALAAGSWARFPLAFLAFGTTVHALLTLVLRGWPSEHEIRVGAEGLEWRRGRRVDAAPWSAITSVRAREAIGNNDHPAVRVRVRGPSGLEHTWVDIWDIYTLPRAALAARLQGWLERSDRSLAAQPGSLGERVTSEAFKSTVRGLLVVVVLVHAALLLLLLLRS